MQNVFLRTGFPCRWYFIFSNFSKKSTYAKMISIDPSSLLIIGSFKKQTVDPDFKVKLLMIHILFLIISKEQPIQCENLFKYDELNKKNKFVRFTILNTWICSSTTWQSYFSFDLTYSFVRFFAFPHFAWNHKDSLLIDWVNSFVDCSTVYRIHTQFDWKMKCRGNRFFIKKIFNQNFLLTKRK